MSQPQTVRARLRSAVFDVLDNTLFHRGFTGKELPAVADEVVAVVLEEMVDMGRETGCPLDPRNPHDAVKILAKHTPRQPAAQGEALAAIDTLNVLIRQHASSRADHVSRAPADDDPNLA